MTEAEKAKKRTDNANEKSKILSRWRNGYFKGHYKEDKELAYKKALKSLNKSLKARGIKMEEV
tara:strand:- start:987 stop:1175 length:189 start_codon:yes stop_codon:yes gene_type:complete